MITPYARYKHLGAKNKHLTQDLRKPYKTKGAL